MTPQAPESFVEVKFRVPREQCDAACNYIVENITNGMVLEDEDESDDTIITFYVPSGEHKDYRTPLSQYLSDIIPGGIVPRLNEKVVRNVEWVEQYKQSIQPIWITDQLRIRATWHEHDPTAKYELVIEPKMAFGTGTHETTRSCLSIIQDQFKPGMRFLDLGCGSGILSMLADKMGAAFIKAVDYDVVAVENCNENFALNGLKADHAVSFGTIDKCVGDKPYDFVCANIIKSTILPILPYLIQLTNAGGYLVLSGLLDTDEEDTSSAIRDAGQQDFEFLRDNKWLTYTIRRR